MEKFHSVCLFLSIHLFFSDNFVVVDTKKEKTKFPFIIIIWLDSFCQFVVFFQTNDKLMLEQNNKMIKNQSIDFIRPIETCELAKLFITILNIVIFPVFFHPSWWWCEWVPLPIYDRIDNRIFSWIMLTRWRWWKAAEFFFRFRSPHQKKITKHNGKIINDWIILVTKKRPQWINQFYEWCVCVCGWNLFSVF